MSKDARKALMIAKGQVSSGYLPPGDPQREANLARYMKGANKQVFNKDKSPKTFYHGTTVPEDFSEFSVGNPIHTEDEYGESHRRIYTHNDPTTYLGSHFAEEPEIANEFGVEPPANVARIAMTSKRNLKRINNPDDIMSLPYSIVGTRQRFNIFAGNY